MPCCDITTLVLQCVSSEIYSVSVAMSHHSIPCLWGHNATWAADAGTETAAPCD